MKTITISHFLQPTIPSKYLRPFRTNSTMCANYVEALDCVADGACAWCRGGNISGVHCMPRTSKSCDGFLEINLDAARPSCERKIDCRQCRRVPQTEFGGKSECEWRKTEAKCGVISPGSERGEECETPCHRQESCTACLASSPSCVWNGIQLNFE